MLDMIAGAGAMEEAIEEATTRMVVTSDVQTNKAIKDRDVNVGR